MRICLDIRAPQKGGTRTFTDNFVRNLTAINDKHEFLFLTNHKQEVIDSSLYETLRPPINNPLLQIAWVQSVFSGILNKRKIQAYHSLKHLGPIFSRIKSVYRIRAVGQYCGIYPLGFLENLYWTRMGKIMINRADLIIAVSNYIRNYLIEYFNISEERVVTVYNGLDEFFRPLSGKEISAEFLSKNEIKRPFIFCAGGVVPVKNHETAIKAYKLLKENYKIDETLVIAGGTSHPHFKDLQKLVSGFKLQDSIKFIGYQSRENLRYLYNRAKMLVHPSLHEGCSFTEVEAMACGLPIVCPKTTSHPEIAGDAAVYYNDPKDFEELAFKIKTLIDSKDLLNSLSGKGLKRASRFSWSKCVQNTIAVYDRL